MNNGAPKNDVVKLPHVAVCAGAGMGHLIPALRLTSMLAATKTCKITLIIIRPTLSFAETNQIDAFLATHPEITPYEFHLLPPNTDDHNITSDPFFRHYANVSRSAHLLTDHLLSLTPRVSAVFSDFMLACGIIKPLANVGIPNFTLVVTCARFFALMLSLLKGDLIRGEDIYLSGLVPIRADEPPSLMYKSEDAFVTLIRQNAPYLVHAKGVLLNTIEFFESDSVAALQSGKILEGLAPVFPIGPLHPLKMDKGSNNVVSWLDEQPSKSVVFISFGSRIAMGIEQIKELGKGLEESGMRFLWLVKTTIVDKEDEGDVTSLLGESFFEKTKNIGLVLKEWVNQEEVLAHPSVGGFLTHSGWNTVVEAAEIGMALLAWSWFGDHRVNASVMKDAGLGIWERRWGREGEGLVTADEIAEKIKELMTSEKLKKSVERVADEAKKAWEVDGSSTKMFKTIIDTYAKKTTGNC